MGVKCDISKLCPLELGDAPAPTLKSNQLQSGTSGDNISKNLILGKLPGNFITNYF